MKRTLVVMAAVMLMALFGLAANKERWVNVHVVEADDDTQVDIRVPLSLLIVAVDCVKSDQLQNGKLKLEFDDTQVDFKKLWAELRKHDNTDFVKVSSKEENVLVSRKGDLFIVQVFKKDEPEQGAPHVLVKLPVALMDSLMTTEGNEIDLKAFLTQLGNTTTGDLITVQEKDASVRIWID
ncbi:MAG TPA: hypothetical protein PKM55_14180 [Acidobacteriota bacterium]|nr:hypothetical protein [Acidobacteriota bacterium]